METGVPEDHTSYSELDPEAAYSEVEVDVEAAPRPTVVDEIRATIRQLKRLQGIKGEGFTDAVLRGLGQVVFQNNPLTGLLILLAISVNSFVYAGAALFGAVVGTYVAMLLRIDNKLVRDGLFGFNGALTAIAMVAYTSSEHVHGDLPSLSMILYIALAVGFSTILARAFAFRDQERPRSRAELSVLRRDADATRRDAPVRRRWGGRAASRHRRAAGLCQRYLAVWHRHRDLADLPAGQLADRDRRGRRHRGEFAHRRRSPSSRARRLPWPPAASSARARRSSARACSVITRR